MFNRTEVAEGVSIFTRKTEQFKTVNFSIKLKRPLNTVEAANRTVLTNVLQHSNRAYPTAASLRMHLDDLYGTVLYLDTTKTGNDQVVLLNVETVNDHYLKQGNVLKQVLTLMNKVLFEPNLTEDGYFQPSIVEREKEMVIERIQSVFDEKSRYAQKRLQEIFRPNHPISTSVNGTVEAVQAITPQSLKQTYEKMLAEDLVDIFVIGDIDEEEMVAALKEAFPFKGRKRFEKAPIPTSKATAAYTKETFDTRQGKLHIGYATPVTFEHEDFPKMQIFNGIFGGYPHAKLFMNVREKESLAYYCSSSYSAQYGVMYVMSGIEQENEEKATRLIDEQLEAIREGDISDLEITQTKAMLKNQLKEALDSARGQIELFNQYRDLKEPFTVENMSAKWDAVSKEDVVRMAKQLNKEAVYFLCGEEAE